MAYGDQAFFVKNPIFQKMNGFAKLPICEDIDFFKRLRNLGSVILLNEKALTSPRRWNKQGIWLTTIKNIIIATGARPKYFSGMKPDGKNIITYKEAMSLKEKPKSLVIIGAGAIGIEFADFYNNFGTEVTVIEALPNILPIEDEEVSLELKSFNSCCFNFK